MSDLRDLRDQYGQPLADFEVAMIEANHWEDRGEIAAILGFDREHFGLQELHAVSCGQCGGLFTPLTRHPLTRHLVRHRIACGWSAS